MLLTSRYQRFLRLRIVPQVSKLQRVEVIEGDTQHDKVRRCACIVLISDSSTHEQAGTGVHDGMHDTLPPISSTTVDSRVDIVLSSSKDRGVPRIPSSARIDSPANNLSCDGRAPIRNTNSPRFRVRRAATRFRASSV